MNKKIIFFLCILFILYGCTNDCGINKNNYNKECKYIHISFDDVRYSINNLANNNYDSIWDEPFFGMLKKLHNEYNARFSIYVFLNSDFKNISNKYVEELSESVSWLKFGLHADSSDSIYDKSSYYDGFNSWNCFVNSIISITGTYDSIDRIPRLHYFAGTKETLNGMISANIGPLGFLTSDDNRNSYYLSDEQNKYLLTNDYLIDDNGIYFIGTDMRGDWFSNDFETNNKYDKPIKDNVYEELVYRYSESKYVNDIDYFIWFCHEWQIYDGEKLNENLNWIIDVCRFANDYHIDIDYPQNHLN